MVFESTMICIDNSDYMRNGDYIPTRLQAQQDAVNTVCRFKLRVHPENNVGLLTLAKTEVLATLTTDVSKILTSLHRVQPNGLINILTGIRIAHLALKHRQSKNHKMRIVVFVGSPVNVDDKEIIKLAKRLKKENVNVDIVNFGETETNQSLLETLVSVINGREGTGSHLVTIPPSPHMADALVSSPILQSEDGGPSSRFASGGGYEFGVDPSEDPELALALRVSMEEQRQRQQEEERRVAQESMEEGGTSPAAALTTPTSATVAASDKMQDPSEDELLRQALAMSLEHETIGASAAGTTSDPVPASAAQPSLPIPDFSAMTEEEQIAYAMQISMQDCQPKEEPMEVETKAAAKAEEPPAAKAEPPAEKQEDIEDDFSQVMSDPEFIESVLQSLPGVDPQSQVVREAVGSLTGQDRKKEDKKKDKDSSSKGK